MGTPTGPAIRGASGAEAARTELTAKTADETSTREQHPDQGSIPVSLPPAPRGHLGRRRGRRNVWEGRCQPDAEFKFYLPGHLPLLLPQENLSPSEIGCLNFEQMMSSLIDNLMFFSHPQGRWEFQGKVRTREKNKSSFLDKRERMPRPYSLRKWRVELTVFLEKRKYPNRCCFSCPEPQQITDRVGN